MFYWFLSAAIVHWVWTSVLWNLESRICCLFCFAEFNWLQCLKINKSWVLLFWMRKICKEISRFYTFDVHTPLTNYISLRKTSTRCYCLASIVTSCVCELVERNFWFVIVATWYAVEHFSPWKVYGNWCKFISVWVCRLIYSFHDDLFSSCTDVAENFVIFVPNRVVDLLCKHNPKCVHVICYKQLRRCIVCMKCDSFMHKQRAHLICANRMHRNNQSIFDGACSIDAMSQNELVAVRTHFISVIGLDPF